MTTTVYTDGACCPTNPGPGGWAWATDDGRHRATGHCPRSTNNRMELTAVIEAVRALEGPLLVVTDSRYVVDAMTKGWALRWRREDWEGRKNADLWAELLDLVQHHGQTVRWQWVKGHASDPMNALVDRLANRAALDQTGTATPEALPPPAPAHDQGRLV